MLATGPDMLLSTYLETWLETVKKPPIVRLSTYDKYKWYLKKYINPALGSIRLRILSPQHIQSFYVQMMNEGLSSGTVKNLHIVLHSAMENAMKWNLVSRNVVELVTRPSNAAHEAQVLTIEQARKLIETAKNHKMWALLVMALATGMRRGELLALRWEDVDFQGGKLFVRRAVSKLNGRGYVEHEPKTKKGRRIIVLPSSVIEVLREHQEHVEQAKRKAGKNWLPLGLVFPNTRGNFHRTGEIVAYVRRVGQSKLVFLTCAFTICVIVQLRLCWQWGYIQRSYKRYLVIAPLRLRWICIRMCYPRYSKRRLVR